LELRQPLAGGGGTAIHLAGGKVKTKMAKFARRFSRRTKTTSSREREIGVKGSPPAKSFAEVAGYAYVPVPLPPGLEPG